RRARAGSAARRRLRRELDELDERFRRLLDEAVGQGPLRTQWLEHLRNRAPEPETPLAAPDLVFRGRSDAGSTAEIRRLPSGELEVTVDGTPVERLDLADEFLSPAPAA